MHIRLFVFAWMLFFSFRINAQLPAYPKGYFRNPLAIPMSLVSNFGELRPNHWHMGLDIRTNHRVNQPVYAAADGYIAKIRVEPFGFGQAIFINHPNGLTTVYGHLNKFFPALQRYVIGQQYQQASWPVEVNFSPGQFPVKKGQFIAYSGNTGGSQGPHLHFEIRDTKTTRCLNPLLFGFPVADQVPPILARLAVYDRRLSVYEQSPKLFSLLKTGSVYHIKGQQVIKTDLDKLSFAIQAFDRLSGSTNPIGIYAAKLFIDEKPVLGFAIDSIDYNESRDINAQIDYKYHANGGVYLQHLSQLPGDHSRVYEHISGDGVLTLSDAAVHAIRIEVKDAYLNTSTLAFNIQFDPALAASRPGDRPQQQFYPGYVNVWEQPDFELYLPENALYDTIQPVYYRWEEQTPGAVSALHQFSDAAIPVHGSFSVRIKPVLPTIPAAWKEKLLIKNTGKKTSSVQKAVWQNGWLTASFSSFGSYQAFVDTIPPVINSLGSGDTVNLGNRTAIVFTPKDDFGIAGFRAELDGEWLMFTNDKGRSWIYRMDERCSYGVHRLKVRVTDLAGNETVKTWWFKRLTSSAPVKKHISKKTVTRKKN
ncbi:MAG TPA: M23 family metallopeptidase [Chitinophagaceae bacterium]|jgi:hypothetical protein|nr:M23 family metallopeptidase [Chitinophagaceae bacterium]